MVAKAAGNRSWVTGVITLLAAGYVQAAEPSAPATTISVTIDRGRDLGQNFGSLFEATSADGSVVVGAGFQNAYNTRYRADRHEVQFFVRPAAGNRTFDASELPRPNQLCGTYLYGRDGVIHSTYGGTRSWNTEQQIWQNVANNGGTSETMRVGDGILEFGESQVKYRGRTILSAPDTGSYQLFFYARGYLCFYHVNRGDGPYRPYENDADGFSRLYACPWTPEEATVDLNKAITHTLPVVGETTFAWGQLNDQIVTGSNVGGFYVFSAGAWKMLLAPELGTSYQLYSTMAFGDHLIMGQYPTGRLFKYDGQNLEDLNGWPPKPDGVRGSAREAQTTVVYGGEVFVGVWPWGELWRYHPDNKEWSFVRRMFQHPELSTAVTHPYDEENKGNPVGNLWGQRVTSLVTSGSQLFVSTSAKHPAKWEPDKYPFLAPEKWKSYGAVHQLSAPGHLGAVTKWTSGPTTLEFTVGKDEIRITQDGQTLASAPLTETLQEQINSAGISPDVNWGDGIYGQFSGPAISGRVTSQ